jgi:hypothetical protein
METEMSRINRESRAKTDKFSNLCNDSYAFDESADCSVKAIALAINISYAAAHELAAQNGRKKGRGMFTANICDAVRSQGYELVAHKAQHFIAQYPKSHQILKSVTTHHPERFNKVWADGKTYIMFVKGHVLTIIDGVNHDHTKGRAKQAIEIYEVRKLTSADKAEYQLRYDAEILAAEKFSNAERLADRVYSRHHLRMALGLVEAMKRIGVQLKTVQ